MIGKGSEKNLPVKLCNQANFFLQGAQCDSQPRGVTLKPLSVKPPVQTRGVTLKPPLLNRPFKLS